MSVDLSELIRWLHGWGSDDPALDALMAIGPLVVLTLAVAGRSALTTILAGAYVAGFLLAVARKGLGSDEPR